MADLPDDATEERAGFVILPISLLSHPDLTDCDIRVLLTLDLMGWRDGERDGVVRASNAEIAERAGKKAPTICDSLRRLKKVRPPVIEVVMLARNNRDAIRLVYDRFGGAIGNPIARHRESNNDCPDSQPRYWKSNSGAIGNPTTPPIESIKRDLADAVTEGAIGNPITAPQINTEPPHPSLTLAGLLEWLPTITDNRIALERLNDLAPAWVAWVARKCPQHAAASAEWVQDAILSSSEADDIVPYARKLLRAWVGAGGRPDFELAPRPKAEPDETDTPARAPAPAPVARPSFAQRARAEREAYLATFRRPRPGTQEVTDGDRS